MYRTHDLLLRLSLLALATGAVMMSVSLASAAEVFQYHHENILGTSLDLTVAAGDAKQAAAVESAVLGEVERLRKILSSYDAASEVSRLNIATGPLVCAQETLDVLGAYEQWQVKSHGAYNGHLGSLIELWSKAEKAGALPSDADLQVVLKSLPAPGWKIEPATRTVTRLSAAGTLNVSSLGKGYIVTKAAVAARKSAAGVSGFLVNIGGDIFASGLAAEGKPWEIAVADPKHRADNATPFTKIHLGDRAVSTSAAYERGFTIAGRHYSHILDPRSGMPAEGVASATVVANNNASSNAMATTLCLLKPEEGLALVKSYPGAECLILTADGRQLRSDGFAALESGISPVSPAPSSSYWPSNYQVSIDIEILAASGRKQKRPFVALWVEDSSGKRVRTVTVWGKERKYLPDLRAWWKEAKTNPEWAATVTRATRSAGKHRLQWDGKDDQGQSLPLGAYTITLETNREHGTYCIQKGRIDCGKSPAKGTITAAAEFGETQLTYGPAGQ